MVDQTAGNAEERPRRRAAGECIAAVHAEREGQPPFTAVLSSTFVRHGGEWRLAFHQQSPATDA
jgi:hypothetical protein